MNSDEIQGKWKQLKGSARQQWGKLTDDDVEQIAGQRDKLVGKLQERYGYAREEAQKRADEWLSSSAAHDQQRINERGPERTQQGRPVQQTPRQSSYEMNEPAHKR